MKMTWLIALMTLPALACGQTIAPVSDAPASTAILASQTPATTTITAPTGTAAPAHVMQTVGSVNLRSGAGMSHAVIRVLADDTEVITIGGYVVAEDGGQWVKVRLVDADVIGYVNIDFFEVIP